MDGAINMPLSKLRAELDKLSEADKDKKVYIYCQVGLRGYVATRQLQNRGFKQVANISGGYKSFLQDKSKL